MNDDYKMVPLNKVKAGDFVKRKPDSKTVFIKEHYNREDKTFCLSDAMDMNRSIFLKSKTMVCVGFTY